MAAGNLSALGAAGSNGVFAGTSSISLVDLGDGIGCFELHSERNILNEGLISFLKEHLQPQSDACEEFQAFVIATEAEDFSLGADMDFLLHRMQEKQWAEIDATVRCSQDLNQAIKFCTRPVVVAPAGRCLGSGAEMMLHAASRQPHAELHAGLIETSMGLIPAGGGCKEMTLRALADADAVRLDLRGESNEVLEAMKSTFETLAMAKVSRSATEARTLRLLDKQDSLTMDRGRLLHDAKTRAFQLAATGYAAPTQREDIRAPGTAVRATLQLGIYTLREGAFISEHDARVATHLAHVLTGGPVLPGTLVSERHLLDLEREAFLSLSAEPKTIDRITFTLKNGKPLRN